MKKYLGVVIMVLWLSGCNGEEKFYRIDDINLKFDNSQETMSQKELSVIQEGITKKAVDSKGDIYFSFTPEQGAYYLQGEKHDANLKGGRMQLNDIKLTVKSDVKDTIQLISDKETNCDFFDCEITMTLKRVEEKSPDFVKIKQILDKQKKSE
ncbi:hypothetical protein [Pectobacterium aroidearum]|uniref:hypothetical protein n=1 Tax=Pectobacterium aroidearum TaxID=1201031 RepID=UPI002A7EBEAB|nr:hypothetical protein [Pectobacterium aroidearum]MDY4386584.1 hypothetical protein [Pectobacterium aroidearum]